MECLWNLNSTYMYKYGGQKGHLNSFFNFRFSNAIQLFRLSFLQFECNSAASFFECNSFFVFQMQFSCLFFIFGFSNSICHFIFRMSFKFLVVDIEMCMHTEHMFGYRYKMQKQYTCTQRYRLVGHQCRSEK